MTQQITETLVSDLSGDEIPGDSAGGTVEFTVSGHSYAIDLTAEELDEFNHILGPYVEAARAVSSRSSRRSVAPRRETGHTKEQLASIRFWAQQNGHSISGRGRVPTAVLDAFAAAH